MIIPKNQSPGACTTTVVQAPLLVAYILYHKQDQITVSHSVNRRVPGTNSASPLYHMGACENSVSQAPHTPRVILSEAQRSRRIPSLVTDERPLRHLSVPPLPRGEAHTTVGEGFPLPPLCIYYTTSVFKKQYHTVSTFYLPRRVAKRRCVYLPLWGRGTAIAVDEEIIPYIALPFTRILNPSPNNATTNPFFSAHAAGANTFANSGKSNQKRRKRTASS